VKKGTLYYEKACALVSSDAAAGKDAHVQAQLLLTQGLLFFASEQVRGKVDVLSCYSRGFFKCGHKQYLALSGAKVISVSCPR
jgi:hypothetical protein